MPGPNRGHRAGGCPVPKGTRSWSGGRSQRGHRAGRVFHLRSRRIGKQRSCLLQTRAPRNRMPGKVETAAGATAPTAALMDTVETAAGATAPVAASTNELRGTTAELFVANRRPTVETAVTGCCFEVVQKLHAPERFGPTVARCIKTTTPKPVVVGNNEPSPRAPRPLHDGGAGRRP